MHCAFSNQVNHKPDVGILNIEAAILEAHLPCLFAVSSGGTQLSKTSSRNNHPNSKVIYIKGYL